MCAVTLTCLPRPSSDGGTRALLLPLLAHLAVNTRHTWAGKVREIVLITFDEQEVARESKAGMQPAPPVSHLAVFNYVVDAHSEVCMDTFDRQPAQARR